MSASTEPRTRDFFHGYADRFDAIYGTEHTRWNALVNRLFRASMRLRFERTLAGCDPVAGASVLDIGCGPGHYAVELARRGAERVVGIDFADNMIARAIEHAAAAGVADRCEFLVGDIDHWQPDERFDYVVVMGFMDYVADPEALVRAAVGLTRRRAFFSFPAAGGLLAWQRRLRYRNRCPLYLYTPARLRAVLDAVPGASFSIEPVARDYFVTATPTEPAPA